MASRDQLKIFVGGLPQQTTKASLDQYFAQYGYADSYVMQDKATGRSRGFGFVNFTDAMVMEAVLQMSHEVDGCPITVSPYAGSGNYNPRAGKPSAPAGGGGFSEAAGGAGGMDTSGTTAMLTQIQQQLQAVAAAAQGGGGGRGGGEVAAPSPNAGDGSTNSMKIFVGGLAQHTTKESLNSYFSQFGHADSYVMMDKATGRSRGFGFVNFNEERVVQMVLQYSHEVDGTIITVSPYEGAKAGGSSKPPAVAGGNDAAGTAALLSNTLGLLSKLQNQLGSPAGGQQLQEMSTPAVQAVTMPNKLFVAGLTPSTTTEMLQEAFAPYGPVDCVVMTDKVTGRSRGFGFVTLSDPGTAQAAMAAQHFVDGVQAEVSECWEKGTGPSKSRRIGGPY